MQQGGALLSARQPQTSLPWAAVQVGELPQGLSNRSSVSARRGISLAVRFFQPTGSQPASGFDSQGFREFVANTRNLVKFMTPESGPFLCGL